MTTPGGVAVATPGGVAVATPGGVAEATPGGNARDEVSRLVVSDSHRTHEQEEFPLLTVAKPQLLNDSSGCVCGFARFFMIFFTHTGLVTHLVNKVGVVP